MKPLFLLTKKNLQILLRSKGSALIVIFAPLLIILLLGLAYNTNAQFGLTIGVVAPGANSDAASFVSALEAENFTVVKYEEGVGPCVNDIKASVVHTCIELPDSFSIEDNTQKEVTFHVDPTRINLVWMIQDTVKEKFNLRAQELSAELAGNVLTALSTTKTDLDTRKSEASSIKEKVGSADASAKGVQEQLSSLQITFEQSTPDKQVIEVLESQLEETKTLLETAKTQAANLENASSITQALENASTHLQNSVTLLNEDLTLTVKEPIVANATVQEEANVAVQAANVILNNETNSSQNNNTQENSSAAPEFVEKEITVTSLANLVSVLEADVENAKAQLDAATTQIKTTADGLSSTSSALSEVSGTIDSLNTNLDSMKSTIDAVKVTEAQTISTPFVTKIEKVSEEGTYLSYLFPALLILVIMFSSLALGTTLVMVEKTSPAFFRNFFLPIKKVVFIGSIYLTNLVLIVMQIFIILGLSLFFIPSDAIVAFPAVALVLFIAATTFTFIGMVIGYIFNSEETGILASISLGSVLLFVSGVILPLEAVAPLLRGLVNFNPFVVAEGLIRELFIFGASLGDVWLDLLLLSTYAIMLFVVILFIESFLHQHLAHKFMRTHHKKHKHNDKVKK